jgi:hypothetical protein
MLALTDPQGSDAFARSDAHIDGAYRYSLDRRWSSSGALIAWIMLNPSTADASTDDATIRRIVNFSQRWSFGRLRVVNLYAYRSTDPDALLQTQDPVGPDNDAEIEHACALADRIVCAWGSHPSTQLLFGSGCRIIRESAVRAIIARSGKPCGVLGLTKSGAPRHPLRLAASTPWSPWRP